MFALLLSLVLFLGTVILVLHYGVFDKERFLSLFDSEYFSQTKAYIVDQAKFYTMPTGIDLDVLEGVVDEKEVAGHVRGGVLAAFSGQEYKPDLSAVKSRLDANLKAFFEESDVAFEGDLDNVIEEYEADITSIYEQGITLPGMDAIARIRSLYLKYDLIALAANGAIAVLCLVICIKAHHYVHRGVRYLAYAAGGTALMCCVIPAILYFSKAYAGLNVQPDFFYHFAVSAVTHLLRFMMITGILWFGVMLLLILIAGLLRMRLTRRVH